MFKLRRVDRRSSRDGQCAAPRLARTVPRGGRAEGVKYFLGLAVDMRWPIPTMPAVAVAVRVHRGYKDAREAAQMEAVVPKLARFGANRVAKSDGVVEGSGSGQGAGRFVTVE
jgi:hypothetical protein